MANQDTNMQDNSDTEEVIELSEADNSNDNAISDEDLRDIIDETLEEMDSAKDLQPAARDALRQAAEAYLIDRFGKARVAAMRDNRLTVTAEDMQKTGGEGGTKK